jgi:GntR family transcriptional repressor for pyruvate dehydrogenase complex
MKSIERISVTDEVINRIRSEFLSGRYKIGDKLATERELSGKLGVGRSTVREALKALSALGFIDILQGRGVFVRKTVDDSDDKIRDWFALHEFQLMDFMEVRMSLEPLAVRLAIERASEEEVQRVGDILTLFEKAASESNVVELAHTDEAFHSAIMEATHNRLLITMNQKLAEAFRELRMRSFAVKETASNALIPHIHIFDAILARDILMGQTEMIRHLQITLEDIHKVVEMNLE